MMFDLEIVIQKALTTNKTITDYVAKSKQGYPNIGANRTPHGIFPLIEYHQIMGNDELFCDDKLWTRTYRFQVGIYTEKSDYYKVQDALGKTMRQSGVTCYNDYTYAVDDTKVIHRIFSYTISIDNSRYKQLLKKYNLESE